MCLNRDGILRKAWNFLALKIDTMPNNKLGYPIWRQSFYIYVQNSTFFQHMVVERTPMNPLHIFSDL